MWRIVLIFCQIAICVISENVADSTINISPVADIKSNAGLIRIPLTEVQGPEINTAQFRSQQTLRVKRQTDIPSTETTNKETVNLQAHGGYHKLYTGPIFFGNPPQEFETVFNSAWNSIEVLSARGDIYKFNSSLSTSYKLVGPGQFSIYYFNWLAYGNIATDDITIAGLTIKDHYFGEAFTQHSEDQYYSNFKGVFGLGFTYPNNDKAPLDQLKEENLIEKRIFCFHFNDKMAEGGCELIIGGCDVQAEHYESLINSVEWDIEMPSIEMINKDKTRRKIDCGKGSHARFATGTSITHGPVTGISAINQYLGAVWDDEEELFRLNNCEETSLPDIEFTFGERFNVTIKPADYIIQQMFSVDETTCFTIFKSHKSNELNYYSFGVNILQKFVPIFDMEEMRIGFARRPN